MIRASTLRPTPEMLTAEDARIRRAAALYGDLESDVCDVADMATLCDHLSDHFQDELVGMAHRGSLDEKRVAEQAQRSSEMLVFAVNHLSAMARQMRKKYYTEVEKD
jgi:hypothetical protein